MDKKQILLNTALRLFVKHGFHDTPTAKIAKKAGIANGTLFYFFPSKDDLIRALYLDIKTRTTEYILSHIEGITATRQLLHGYFTLGLKWGLKNTDEFRFVAHFTSSPYRDQIARNEVEHHIRPLLDLLEKAIEEKLIKPLDVNLLFSLFSGQVFSVSNYLLDKRPDAQETNDLIEEAFDLFWTMVKCEN